ncbi:MAG: NAD-dependent epimerase/dehydratase family protein, partial [Bacteroidota bacterium]
MDKNSKIFVAGYRGLVGSAILRKLQALGYANIVARDRAELDLRDSEAVNRFFASQKPEYVFLAAAKVGGILANNTYKAEFIYDNIAIATNAVDASYRFG